MARTKETPYDLAVHREDRPPKPPRQHRGPNRRKPHLGASANLPGPEGLDRLEQLVGPAFRGELPKRLGDIDPLAMVEILEPYITVERKAREVAGYFRREHDEKVRGSLAWRRRRVRETFKRFRQAVEHLYERYSSGGVAPADPITFPVLRLTRELDDALKRVRASKLQDARWSDFDREVIRRQRGPITAYASNDGRTHAAEVRYYLKARFGMGRIQQDWWLLAVNATI